MKFTKPFYGVPAGLIYPIQYEAGDDCPPELLDAAKSVGAVDVIEQSALLQAAGTGVSPVLLETVSTTVPDANLEAANAAEHASKPEGAEPTEATRVLPVVEEGKAGGKDKNVPNA